MDENQWKNEYLNRLKVVPSRTWCCKCGARIESFPCKCQSTVWTFQLCYAMNPEKAKPEEGGWERAMVRAGEPSKIAELVADGLFQRDPACHQSFIFVSDDGGKTHKLFKATVRINPFFVMNEIKQDGGSSGV